MGSSNAVLGCTQTDISPSAVVDLLIACYGGPDWTGSDLATVDRLDRQFDSAQTHDGCAGLRPVFISVSSGGATTGNLSIHLGPRARVGLAVVSHCATPVQSQQVTLDGHLAYRRHVSPGPVALDNQHVHHFDYLARRCRDLCGPHLRHAATVVPILPERCSGRRWAGTVDSAALVETDSSCRLCVCSHVHGHAVLAHGVARQCS